MATERRQTNSYHAYEIDVELEVVKATVTVIQFTRYTIFAPIAGPKSELPGAVDYMIDTGREAIHVNEVREMNGMTFPAGSVFQSLDRRVYFSKAYFDEMNQDA
jgi:hypothetical protein